METTSLSLVARNLINGLNSDNSNSSVLDNWKTLASTLNQFATYEEMPYRSDIPLAMYMYVMKYSSKRGEENSIRAITTFGVLMNAIEHSEGKERRDYLVLVSLLITKYIKHFKNVSNYKIFPITVPQQKEYYNQIITDYGNTSAYFNSIFLFIYNHVDSDSQSFFGYDEIKSQFISNKESFFEEYHQEQHGLEETLDGENVLRECYHRMNQIGKCPIFVPSTLNTEICNKTYGLIPLSIAFNVEKFFLHETSGTVSEGESNSQINIDLQEGILSLFCKGINEHYLKSELFLPIEESYVKKIDQHIELTFNISEIYQDGGQKYGNIDNVPTSMDLHFEHFKLTQIVFSFIVGDQGRLRTLHLYGNCI